MRSRVAAVVGGERGIELVRERGLVPLYIIISGKDWRWVDMTYLPLQSLAAASSCFPRWSLVLPDLRRVRDWCLVVLGFELEVEVLLHRSSDVLQGLFVANVAYAK